MVMNLSDRKWEAFFIINVLGKSHNSKPYHSRNLSITMQQGIPYITRTSVNNGLYAIVENKNYELNPANSISFGAENAEYFFQPQKFITGNKMYYYCVPKNNHYIALFLVNCLNKAISNCGFGYGMGLTGTRSDTRKVMLPINNEGKPDFVFMKSYMREQEATKKLSYIKFVQKQIAKINYKELPLISELNWQDFKVCDLFDYKRGNQKNMNSLAEGNNMLISAKNIDNGLKGFFNSNTCKNDIYKGNCISLNNDGDGGVGLAYYQPHDFLLDTHVYALYPKNDLSSYSMIYITIALSKQRSCFHHGYSISQERLKKMKIMLPVNTQGKPYYEYMEQYTKNIMYVKLKKYLEYVDHEIPREE